MEKQSSFTIGSALLVLAAAGFLQKRKHFLWLMNVDTAHSIIRIPLAALLFYGSQAELKTTRSILLGTGIIYILIGAAGLKDRTVGGLLPSKLTGVDFVYHFGVGAIALWLGGRTGRMLKP